MSMGRPGCISWLLASWDVSYDCVHARLSDAGGTHTSGIVDSLLGTAAPATEMHDHPRASAACIELTLSFIVLVLCRIASHNHCLIWQYFSIFITLTSSRAECIADLTSLWQ